MVHSIKNKKPKKKKKNFKDHHPPCTLTPFPRPPCLCPPGLDLPQLWAQRVGGSQGAGWPRGPALGPHLLSQCRAGWGVRFIYVPLAHSSTYASPPPRPLHVSVPLLIPLQLPGLPQSSSQPREVGWTGATSFGISRVSLLRDPHLLPAVLSCSLPIRVSWVCQALGGGEGHPQTQREARAAALPTTWQSVQDAGGPTLMGRILTYSHPSPAPGPSAMISPSLLSLAPLAESALSNCTVFLAVGENLFVGVSLV